MTWVATAPMELTARQALARVGSAPPTALEARPTQTSATVRTTVTASLTSALAPTPA